MTSPAIPEMTKLLVRCEFADGQAYELEIPKPVKPEVVLEEVDGFTLATGAAHEVLNWAVPEHLDSLIFRDGWRFTVAGTVAPSKEPVVLRKLS